MGGRSYERGSGPNEKIIDPTKRVRSESKNPLVVAVDVTGSMASWPAEIFDRLPLRYNTLSQFRGDLELADDPVPSAPDIGDVAFLMGLGYRTFLLGDAVCLQRDSVLAALNLLEAVAGELD